MSAFVGRSKQVEHGGGVRKHVRAAFFRQPDLLRYDRQRQVLGQIGRRIEPAAGDQIPDEVFGGGGDLRV